MRRTYDPRGEGRAYALGAKRTLQFLALAFAIAAVWFLLVSPGYVQVTSDSSGRETVVTRTILDVNGIASLFVLAIPVALTTVPVVLRRRAWQAGSIACSILLAVFAALGALSIGVYFVPAVVVALIAVLVPAPTGPR